MNVEDIIENAFWCYDSPVRNELIKLMTKASKESGYMRDNSFFKELRDQLSSSKFIFQGKEACNSILKLFSMLSLHNKEILQELSNFACLIPNRSLLEEVEAYMNDKMSELQSRRSLYGFIIPFLIVAQLDR